MKTPHNTIAMLVGGPRNGEEMSVKDPGGFFPVVHGYELVLQSTWILGGESVWWEYKYCGD